MKRFSLNFLIFIIPIILFLIITEYALREIPNDYSYKNNYLKNNAHNIETLFLGSSHTYYGINPDYFPGNSFNASHISQSIDLDYKLINKYSDKFENIENIVIPIDYFSLFSRTSTGIEYWRMKNYNLYYNLNTSTNPKDYMEIFSFSIKKNIGRIIDYYYYGKSNITCSTLGYGNLERKQADLIETGKTAAARHTKKDKKLLDESIEIIIEIIEYSRQKNVDVLFYTSPAYKTYRNNLDSGQYQLTINTIDSISNKYDNAYYYNLISDEGFTQEDFRDADHLNENGAKKLTNKIARIIEKNKARTHNIGYK